MKKFLAIVDRDKTSAHFEFRISLYLRRERETFAHLSPSVHPPCAGFRHDRIDDGALYRLLAAYKYSADAAAATGSGQINVPEDSRIFFFRARAYVRLSTLFF